MDLKELAGGIDPECHWYYQAKLQPLLAWYERLDARGRAPATLIDFGAGSGFFALALAARFPDLIRQLVLVDAYFTDEDLALETSSTARVERYRELPHGLGDCGIIFMDVLEHIEDERALLRELASRLPHGTPTFITVPAFQALWSPHDEFLGHYRRYTLAHLEQVVEENGWRVARSAYLFALLLPVAALVRWFQRLAGSEERSDMRPTPEPLNSLVLAWHRLEMKLAPMNGIGGLSCALEGVSGNGKTVRESRLGQEVLGFALVGGLGTLTHLLVLLLGVEVLGLGPLLATSIGFIAAVVQNYLLNRTLVFRSAVQHRRGLPRFLVVALAGLLLNTGVMALLLETTSLHYLLAQLLTVLVVMAWNFLGNRRWTFDGKPGANTA